MTNLREYTLRYLNAEGRFVATVEVQCATVREAVSKAVLYLSEHYEALEVSLDGGVVWHGLREDAIRIAHSD